MAHHDAQSPGPSADDDGSGVGSRDRARAHARGHDGGQDRHPRLDGRIARRLRGRQAAGVAPAARLPRRRRDRPRRDRQEGAAPPADRQRHRAPTRCGPRARPALRAHRARAARRPRPLARAPGSGAARSARPRRAGSVHRPWDPGDHARRLASGHARGPGSAVRPPAGPHRQGRQRRAVARARVRGGSRLREPGVVVPAVVGSRDPGLDAAAAAARTGRARGAPTARPGRTRNAAEHPARCGACETWAGGSPRR